MMTRGTGQTNRRFNQKDQTSAPRPIQLDSHSDENLKKEEKKEIAAHENAKVSLLAPLEDGANEDVPALESQ